MLNDTTYHQTIIIVNSNSWSTCKYSGTCWQKTRPCEDYFTLYSTYRNLWMDSCLVFIFTWEFLYLSPHGCLHGIYTQMGIFIFSPDGCLVFVFTWEFLYLLRMAVWYLSSHGNFYIFSGWLSGIYCLMGIFIFISGWLSSVYFHMGTFIFISRWLSGIYLHICLNLSPGGCLIFIFSWEYVYLYLDGCVVFLYFKTDKQLKTRKSL